MFKERGLDLDRRDPKAADLDHVVGAALLTVEAILVRAVAVPGEEPLAQDRAFRLFVLRPVKGQGAVAFDVEITGFAFLYGLALVVEDLQLIPGHGLAAGPGLDLVQPVRAIDVEHLGRADAVEDGQAVSVLPATPHLGGRGPGGGEPRPGA